MRRVTASGAVIRVTTPDLRKYVAAYTGAEPGFFQKHREQLERIGLEDVPARPAWMLNQIFQFWGHEWIYDLDEMAVLAEAAGFPPGAVVPCAYRIGHDPDMAGLDKEVRADEALYVEILT